jgi:hypothetical protein
VHDVREQQQEGTCGECEHGEEWVTKLDPRAPGLGGHRTGFVICAKSGARATYFAGRLACHLTPSRFQKRADTSTMTVMRGEDGKLTGFSEKDKRAYGKFKKTIEELEEMHHSRRRSSRSP